MPHTEDEKSRAVNLDEIEPESAGAPETGDPETPECEDSPSGQHEFDESADDPDKEVCVYCGKEKN